LLAEPTNHGVSTSMDRIDLGLRKWFIAKRNAMRLVGVERRRVLDGIVKNEPLGYLGPAVCDHLRKDSQLVECPTTRMSTMRISAF